MRRDPLTRTPAPNCVPGLRRPSRPISGGALREMAMCSRLIGLSLCVALGAACGEEAQPPPRFPFTFHTTSDGRPFGGVTVRVNDTELGATDESGTLRQDLTGPEGVPVLVSATCPEGYRSPEAPQQVTLRTIQSLDPAAAARGVQVTFDCPPEHRDAVVIVRTHDQAGLPVLVDGREVARTDASGAAHVHMRTAPQTTFQIRIATADNELLRPRDPVMSFTVPDHDAVFSFDQRFEEEQRVRRRGRRRPRPAPASRLPIRIGGG